MEFPELSVPVTLPFDVPMMLHPAVVHFAIALPVVILLIEIINLFVKRPSLSGTALFLWILAMVTFAAAYFTGKADGSEAGPLLEAAGMQELKDHKMFGIYLLYGSAIPLLFKLFSLMLRGWMKALYLLTLIIFIVFLFKQGKDGGELVFTHGANVKEVQVQADKAEDCSFALEECNEAAGAAPEAVEEEDAPEAVTAVIETVDEAVETATESAQEMIEEAPSAQEAADEMIEVVTTPEETTVDANESDAVEDVEALMTGFIHQ